MPKYSGVVTSLGMDGTSNTADNVTSNTASDVIRHTFVLPKKQYMMFQELFHRRKMAALATGEKETMGDLLGKMIEEYCQKRKGE